MHRDLSDLAPCCVLLAAVMPAAAQGETKGAACVEASKAAPERVIEDCDALLTDKATADAKLPGIFLARAEAFVRQGRPKLAIEDLGNVIERRPDNAGAFLKRAELHRTLGDADAAIRDFSAAIRFEPKNAKALFARGELYLAKGRSPPGAWPTMPPCCASTRRTRLRARSTRRWRWRSNGSAR